MQCVTSQSLEANPACTIRNKFWDIIVVILFISLQKQEHSFIRLCGGGFLKKDTG